MLRGVSEIFGSVHVNRAKSQGFEPGPKGAKILVTRKLTVLPASSGCLIQSRECSKGSEKRRMGSVFHMMCPLHGDPNQVTAATCMAFEAIRPLTFINLNALILRSEMTDFW